MPHFTYSRTVIVIGYRTVLGTYFLLLVGYFLLWLKENRASTSGKCCATLPLRYHGQKSFEDHMIVSVSSSGYLTYDKSTGNLAITWRDFIYFVSYSRASSQVTSAIYTHKYEIYYRTMKCFARKSI